MGIKSKPKIYYWLPVFALFGIFCLLGVVMLVSYPKFTKFIPNSPLADIGWESQLERSLESVGVIVHDLKIVGDLDQQRQLQISISNIIGDDEPQPYYLVSGIHVIVGTGLYYADTHSSKIDSILINVFNDNKEYLYSITIKESDLRGVILKEISEQEFLNRWVISGEAPELFNIK